MSRSYKLRHLPKLGANKFVEGVGPRFWHNRVFVYGYPQFYTRWPDGDGYANAPVASPGSHPWAWWRCCDRATAVSGRKYWAKVAHRKARRRVKSVLKDPNFDYEAEVLLTSDDFFDTWQFA